MRSKFIHAVNWLLRELFYQYRYHCELRHRIQTAKQLKENNYFSNAFADGNVEC